MGRFFYRLVRTEWGWAGLAGGGNGVARVCLPAGDRASVVRALGEGTGNQLVETEGELGEAAEELAAYFEGEPVQFSCKVEVSRFTEFERAVWRVTQRIRYGQLRSYGWVAEQIGRPGAGRAVGQALGKNPVPVIVPCHRVVCRDGKLGGFRSGLEWKVRLLKMEKRRKGNSS